MIRQLADSLIGTFFCAVVVSAPLTLADEIEVPVAPDDVGYRLPAFEGTYTVGVRSFIWVDDTRSKSGLPEDDGNREIAVTAWYPANALPGQKPALYSPGIETILAAIDTVPENRKNFINAHKPLLNVATNSIPGANAATTQTGWPVILFSPGGNVSRHFQTALAERVASIGFVFVAMSHPYSSIDVSPTSGFSMSINWDLDNEDRQIADQNDNRLAEILAKDATFVLQNMLEDASNGNALGAVMDFDRVGIIGHSRGGKTVGRACSSDDSFKACIVMDNIGPASERLTGIEQPFLTIRSEWDEDRVAELHDYLGRTGSTSHDAVLLNSNHFSCTDMPLFIPELRVEGTDPDEGINACASIVTEFFNAYLSDGATPDSDWLSDGLRSQVSMQRFESRPAQMEEQ